MFTAVYLPAALLAFCNGLLIPTLPLFVDDFGVPFSIVGLVLAGEALGTLLADLPSGHLLRRFDQKTVMAVGVGLVVVSVAALALAEDVIVILALRLLAGAGAAMWNLSRHAFLAEATQSRGRGRALASFGGVMRLGMFLGPAVGGLIASLYGLRAPFLLYAVIAAIALVSVLRFVPRRASASSVPAGAPAGLRVAGGSEPATRRAATGPTPDRPTPAGVAGVAGAPGATRGRPPGRLGILAAAGAAQLMAQMLRAGRKVLLPLFAAGVLGLDVAAVGIVLSVSAFVDLAMFYPAGWLMDNRGRKSAIVPSFLVQAVALALVPLTGGFVGILLVGVMLGVGNGLGTGTMMTLGADLAPPGALGEFLGAWRLVGDSGSTAGPLVVGAVAEALDLGLAAIVIAAIGLAAAGMFAWRVPETLARPTGVRASS